ncbi:hypothetical protein C8R45DRAFT_592631 [Mycena sanguinolenta]|nr:hypothetical protein C8R45DRAFT_592631 [Mycena sanguinolenta]
MRFLLPFFWRLPQEFCVVSKIGVHEGGWRFSSGSRERRLTFGIVQQQRLSENCSLSAYPIIQYRIRNYAGRRSYQPGIQAHVPPLQVAQKTEDRELEFGCTEETTPRLAFGWRWLTLAKPPRHGAPILLRAPAHLTPAPHSMLAGNAENIAALSLQREAGAGTLSHLQIVPPQSRQLACTSGCPSADEEARRLTFAALHSRIRAAFFVSSQLSPRPPAASCGVFAAECGAMSGTLVGNLAEPQACIQIPSGLGVGAVCCLQRWGLYRAGRAGCGCRKPSLPHHRATHRLYLLWFRYVDWSSTTKLHLDNAQIDNSQLGWRRLVQQATTTALSPCPANRRGRAGEALKRIRIFIQGG